MFPSSPDIGIGCAYVCVRTDVTSSESYVVYANLYKLNPWIFFLPVFVCECTEQVQNHLYS